MLPRQQLQAAPYAFNSLAVAGSIPGSAAGNLPILDGAAKIPAGMVAGSSLSLPLDASSSGSYLLNLNATAGGSALIAQSASGIGVSATSASASQPALFASAPIALKLSAGSVGLQASTQAGDQTVSLADRNAKAGLASFVSGASASGVSASASAGSGVFGTSSSLSATDYGVLGTQTGNAAAGVGVEGFGFIGVQGQANQASGRGVEGDVDATLSNAIAVLGINNYVSGTATVGRHLGLGSGMGMRGSSTNGVGAIGVYGTVSGAAAIGVQGFASATDAYGVVGTQNSLSPLTLAAGVYGKSRGSFSGMGVRGEGFQGVYGQGNSNAYCGVCAYTANPTGYGLYANGTQQAVLAESTAVSGQGFGIAASILSTSNGSAAGQFLAQASSGQSSAVFASNASPAGFGVYAVSPNVNYYSDPSSASLFGFYHADSGAPPGGVGVYSAENCDSCFGGIFINTATTGSSGAALNVQGRLRIQSSAGTFTAPNGATSFTLSNSYIASNSLIFLTVATATSSVAAVTSKSSGSASITFTPALSGNTTYQFLIIGQ
jgi:hypothetical protein